MSLQHWWWPPWCSVPGNIYYHRLSTPDHHLGLGGDGDGVGDGLADGGDNGVGGEVIGDDGDGCNCIVDDCDSGDVGDDGVGDAMLGYVDGESLGEGGDGNVEGARDHPAPPSSLVWR